MKHTSTLLLFSLIIIWSCKNEQNQNTPFELSSKTEDAETNEPEEVKPLPLGESQTGYLVLDKRLAEILINGTIPEDFPRQMESETVDIYADRVIVWGKENEELIQEQYRANLDNPALKEKIVQKLKTSPGR